MSDGRWVTLVTFTKNQDIHCVKLLQNSRNRLHNTSNEFVEKENNMFCTQSTICVEAKEFENKIQVICNDVFIKEIDLGSLIGFYESLLGFFG